MKKNLTELVFILDKSGSMWNLSDDTIGGYNALLKQNKMMEGEALVSTVLFNHKSQVLHDRVPIESVAPLTSRDYAPSGCTALLDAVGARFIITSTCSAFCHPSCALNTPCFASLPTASRTRARSTATLGSNT